MDEFERIDAMIAPLARGHAGTFDLTNDAAVLAPSPGNEIVLTKDMMAEGVHFLPDDPPEQVAAKLLRTNLSDLAAMGARARGYLLGLGLDGGRDEDWLARFFEGLAQDQTLFDVFLLGGDTIVARKGILTLSLTAVGEIRAGAALTRSGAREGDIVAVSGTIGDAALGLLVRRGELGGLSAGDRAWLEDRYRLPQPRMALGQGLVGLAHAALDVSDGLMADAGHLARRSGMRIELAWDQVPLSAAARRAVGMAPELRDTVVGGGDDYELLFTLPQERWDALLRVAQDCDTPVTRIGRCRAGQGVAILDASGENFAPAIGGWRHGEQG
ncbi:MAG: thiamine-phosphate kinase [Proteobacteria bacterium]|nr:thiamine-phosphate kinase [Pseudomonadota bacterium]